MNLMLSAYRTLLIPGVSLALLCACNRHSGPGPEIHDTKYVLIDAAGKILDHQTSDHATADGSENHCVLDQFIGLTWEIKSDRPGLRDWRNTYSWYDPGESYAGDLDYRGTPDGGLCTGSGCDTAAYVAAVNVSGYCGHSDWRLPARDELGSISDPRKSRTPPTINTMYFPYTQSGEYWSANDYQFQYDTAWLWNFKDGLDRVEWKKSPRFVRLVRGQAQMLQQVKE